MSLAERTTFLLDRLMGRGVVLFSGAGVSTGGRDPEDKHYRPTIWWLQQRLVEEVHERARAESHPALLAELGLPVTERRSFRGESILQLRRDGLTDGKIFPKLAEAFQARWGGAELCRVLEIERLYRLTPTPHHRYVARLAREGLIEEVLTTNYDTCYERAYCDSFDLVDRASVMHEGQDGAGPVRICNLDDYRRWGGAREDDQGRPRLHVVKLNGCAASWAAKRSTPGGAEEAAESILLTERQLQTLDHPWSRDLLRDRSRRLCLFFNGFGSDEPQVRFTMLQLVAEFRGTARSAAGGAFRDNYGWNQRNAPFVARFDAHLTFPQVQLMRAWAQSHGLTAPHPGEDLLNLEEINVLGPQDRAALGLTEPSPGLGADELWLVLYGRVFQRLLERATAPGSAWASWARQHGLPWGRWRNLLMEWAERLQPAEEHPVAQNPLRSTPPAEDKRALPPSLHTVMAAVRGEESLLSYTAFRDDPVFAVSACILFRLLNVPGTTSETIAGSRLEATICTQDHGTIRLAFTDGADAAVRPRGDRALLRVIELPSSRARSEQRHLIVDGENARFVRVSTLSFAEVLAALPEGEEPRDEALLLAARATPSPGGPRRRARLLHTEGSSRV